MAITLGTFTQLDDGVLTGTFKTLNVTASLAIVPIDKTSDKAPDHRVYAGPRHEVGAGWSQVAKSSGETYINLKIGSPEFGPNWVRCRLVKLDKPAEEGATTSPSGNRATSEHQRPAARPAAGPPFSEPEIPCLMFGAARYAAVLARVCGAVDMPTHPHNHLTSCPLFDPRGRRWVDICRGALRPDEILLISRAPRPSKARPCAGPEIARSDAQGQGPEHREHDRGLTL